MGFTVAGRTDEFFVYNANPTSVKETINKQGIQKDYWLTEFSDEKPHSYDAEGYTNKTIDYLMNLNLGSWSFEEANKIIKRVKAEEKAQGINHFFNKKVFDLTKLNNPNLDYYIGEENGGPVAKEAIYYFCHFHICKFDGGEWVEKLLFRDYLRLYPEITEGYVQKKGTSL